MTQRQFYENIKDSIKFLDERDKLVNELSNPENSSFNQYKKNIIQIKCNPIINHARPFLAKSKNQEDNYNSQFIKAKIEQKGYENVTSTSFESESNQKRTDSSLDYLAFLQQHQIFEQTRKVGRVNEQKSKKENCSIQDDLKIKLVQQIQQYQTLLNNYRQAVQKCAQLQVLIQQKDALIRQANLKNDVNVSQINVQTDMLKELQWQINRLQGQNQQLRLSVLELSNQTRVPSKQKDIQIDISKFEQMGHEFEQKTNQLQQQNSKLKNVIGHLQGKVGQLQMQKTALQSLVNALQQRNSNIKESVLESQIQYFRKKLQDQKEDKDRLVSKYQLQILKLQILIKSEQYLKTESLLDFSDEERLQEKLMLAIVEIEQLKSRLRPQI